MNECRLKEFKAKIFKIYNINMGKRTPGGGDQSKKHFHQNMGLGQTRSLDPGTSMRRLEGKGGRKNGMRLGIGERLLSCSHERWRNTELKSLVWCSSCIKTEKRIHDHDS